MNPNIAQQIKEVNDGDMSYLCKKAFKAGLLLGCFRQAIEQFTEKFPDARIILDTGELTLRQPSRELALAFIKEFGGNWKKEIEDWYPDKIRYTQTHTIFDETVTLKVSEAPPPPSCQIIEEEVEVPARMEKKRRIVCKPDEDEVPLEILEKVGETVETSL